MNLKYIVERFKLCVSIYKSGLIYLPTKLSEFTLQFY